MSNQAARMDEKQIEEFLAAPRHAVLAIAREDAPPLVSTVWYLFEGGRFYVSTWAASQKVRWLRRDPRLGVCVDGGHPDARFVTLYGVAELRDGASPEALEMNWRITRRYCESDEAARRYLAALPDEPGVLLAITPETLFGRDFN